MKNSFSRSALIMRPIPQFTPVKGSGALSTGIHARLFVGCLASTPAFQAHTPKLITEFEKAIGPIVDIWPSEKGWIAPCSYAQEMGDDLTTMVFVFDGFWQPESLSWVKRRTLEIEDHFTPIQSRRFNLNPGVVDNVSMRLASHKPSHRRRQISEDVWVEDQMYWSGNKLMPLGYVFQEYVMGTRLARLNSLGKGVLSREQMTEFCVTTKAHTFGSVVRLNPTSPFFRMQVHAKSCHV